MYTSHVHTERNIKIHSIHNVHNTHTCTYYLLQNKHTMHYMHYTQILCTHYTYYTLCTIHTMHTIHFTLYYTHYTYYTHTLPSTALNVPYPHASSFANTQFKVSPFAYVLVPRPCRRPAWKKPTRGGKME